MFLVDRRKDKPDTEVKLQSANAGFRGLTWSPDGSRLFASTDKGYVQEFRFKEGKLELGKMIYLQDPKIKDNPVPGGLAIVRDGSRIYVAAANLNAIVVIDLKTYDVLHSYPVENLPFEPVLSPDEKTLIASNWGGHLPRPGELTGKSDKLDIAVDQREVTSSGDHQPHRPGHRRDSPCRGRAAPDGPGCRGRPMLRRQRDERLDL